MAMVHLGLFIERISFRSHQHIRDEFLCLYRAVNEYELTESSCVQSGKTIEIAFQRIEN